MNARTRPMKLSAITALMLVWGSLAIADLKAQGVRIDGDLSPTLTVDPSALLHLDGSSATATAQRGMSYPNVALDRTDVPTLLPLPLPPSLIVYNTTTSTLTGNDAAFNVRPGYYYWDGARWLRLEAGVGKQTYYNCSTNLLATLTRPLTVLAGNWGLSGPAPASYIPIGCASGGPTSTNGTTFDLAAGDRVFLEAMGAVEFTAPADPNSYTDVEIELVCSTTGLIANPLILARTVVSLDLRGIAGGSTPFFFGIFSANSSGFSQLMAVRHYQLQAIFDVPSTSAAWRFWLRLRKTRNVGTVKTGGDPIKAATGFTTSNSPCCIRTEILRQ